MVGKPEAMLGLPGAEWIRVPEIDLGGVTVLRRPAIGPTLSSCNRRRSSELRQSWATVVELGWNNSRTRVGVAELSAGRVAWAKRCRGYE